jgi:hypothetical protein
MVSSDYMSVLVGICLMSLFILFIVLGILASKDK